jgi:hypothetical protein
MKSLSMNRLLLCLSPGIVAFFVAALVSLWVPAYPNIHDDFGNLLVADTLLHGRLSNPTPPSHELLQSFHIVVEPSYAAKFPIGSGALMAIGKLMFGEWKVGMWIAASVACIAITWMLLVALPMRWAWTFGMLSALHPMWQTGWSQEFTHGWLAVGSVALILGGLIRMRRLGVGHWRSASIAIACGLVLGMFSRPFEIALLAGLLSLPFAYEWFRSGLIYKREAWLALSPAALILILGFGMQGVVNHQVTGSWLRLPYQLHEDQYGVAPVFVWQRPHEPSVGHRFPEQVAFHRGWSMEAYESAASWSGYGRLMGVRVLHLVKHWGWFLALAPIAAVAIRRVRGQYLGICFAAVGALLVINAIPWVSPNYVAPLIPVAIFLSAVGIRAALHVMAQSSSDESGAEESGRVYSHRERLQHVVMIGLLISQIVGLVVCTRSMVQARNSDPLPWFVERAQTEAQLIEREGNHLVIVRYAPGHNIHHEWVFNAADPATSRIVWARWDESHVDSLRTNYPNRTVWILEVASDDSHRLLPWESHCADNPTLAHSGC